MVEDYFKAPVWKIDYDYQQVTCKFKDDDDLQKHLAFWKHVLHLDHWCIEAGLVENLKNEESGEERVHGLNYCVPQSCEASIAINTTDDEDSYVKHCEELTLVHELLHCVIPMYEREESTLEGTAYALGVHQRIDLLAKSFIMARYNLDMDWFLK